LDENLRALPAARLWFSESQGELRSEHQVIVELKFRREPPALFNPNSEAGTESAVWGRLSGLPVRAAFQSPDTELESSVNRQTRMSALQTLGSVPARPPSAFVFKYLSAKFGLTPQAFSKYRLAASSLGLVADPAGHPTRNSVSEYA
jgi:hypothetical protein